MKTIIRLLVVLLLPCAAFAQNSAGAAGVSAQMGLDGGHIVIDARGVKPQAPLFFSAIAESRIQAGMSAVTEEIKLALHVVQGRPAVLTLGLSGAGDVADVSGNGLRDWAVREADGRRFLDLRPVLEEGKSGPADLNVTIRVRIPKPSIPGSLALPLLTPGEAVGFASSVTVVPEESVDIRVTKADDMVPVGAASALHSPILFYTSRSASLEIALTQRGAAIADAEIVDARLAGELDEAAACVHFLLTGNAHVRVAGARLTLLSGGAALDDATGGDGWHAELRDDGRTELVFERAGDFPLSIAFAARLGRKDDWQWLNFAMPAGTVVPMMLEGLPANITFDADDPIVPDEATHAGFLPASGQVRLRWRKARDAGEGTLFFTSHEQADVRVGAGLLRQASRLDFRVLQGRLQDVKIRLDGPGEILGVEGENVLAWTVSAAGSQRVLDVRLSRPISKDGTLVVRSQMPLGKFPLKAEPLRLTPEGGVRHSGYLRVANDGAVRLEVAEAAGMMQLAPAQYPGGLAGNDVRQVFVYRFPSATYSCRIVADQILPEVGVSQVTVYELGDTDRLIRADLELDIREAPLREWSLRIPSDFAVAAVNGSAVADYAAETDAADGSRVLKILFDRAVSGRQLIHLRLEKNEPAAAGEWQLPPLAFPGARSVRGHIGVVSASGFRAIPAASENLAEVPLSYFPTQLRGLQQAWRVKDPGWTATVGIEALGQSVQADVFHLYSLKEGVVAGSVLINYFVIGAPANEWRVEVPRALGNIDVAGQNVRRDWRREGDVVIVPLHQPVLGATTLLITFQQPMSAQGGIIKPGEVKPLGVQSERGFLQVVSPLQVRSRILKADGGLLKLEPLEMPAEFRLLTSAPSLAVYQYTARPFDFEMNVEWYAPAEIVDQIVDFAKLNSHVSRDGQVVTDIRYFVKTRGRKALRIVLPGGVQLWEASAAGETVNARVDGEQTIIPLPPRLNPNEPVEVLLRAGQVSRRGSAPVLASPQAQSPTVISEWTITGDPGQLLVRTGGSAQVDDSVLTETGFEWISTHAEASGILLVALLAFTGWLLRARSGWRPVVGFLLAALVAIVAVHLALDAATDRRVNTATLACTAAVVPAGESMTLTLANVSAWRAMVSWRGVGAGIAGLVLAVLGMLRNSRGGARVGWEIPAGAVLLATGLLAQHGGAILFFQLVAGGVFLGMLVPALLRWFRRPRVMAEPLAALLIAGVCLGIAPAARARQGQAAESIVQTWKVMDGRLHGELDVRVRGVAGDSFALLKPPAVLTEFSGDGLRVTKVPRDGKAIYYVALDRDGIFEGHAKFEAPAVDIAKGIALLTGPAVLQRVTVTLDEGGWEFYSDDAVSARQTPDPGANQSGATLVMRAGEALRIGIRARSRDVAAEKPRYYAEAMNLFVPSPGVVSGRCRVTIRPVQGRVSEVQLEVPKGFTVGDVGNGPVGEWRFDPVARKLRVDISPAQEGSFRFDVETQLGTGDLPVELVLEPIRVAGALGEVGMIGLAFGGDAQPENVHGPSAVNLEDFDAGLIPRAPGGQPLATLQQAFRYGRDGDRVTLRVAQVAPEIRAVTRQVLSFGDDRLVMAVDLHVAITRAGVFKLAFALPDWLEIEGISGPSLSDWTEGHEEGLRVVTLQLSGRTIGEQDFTLTFTGAAPPAGEDWPVPRLVLRDAARQTGEIVLVPEKGIRLRAMTRENVSYLDPGAAGSGQPGALAFRLLQQDWILTLGIEALEPWVTAQALEDVTMREGQTLTRIGVHYRVENAAVKQLRVRIPDLTAGQMQTIRASGQAVSDFVKVAGKKDLWEIQFQRGIAGETDVRIEYQGESAREQGREMVRIPAFEGARQVTQFVAVRSSGRLEIDAGPAPRGWQSVDWSMVPANLQDGADRSMPAFCYRVAEPEAPLTVNIHRHAIADALKLRVRSGDLTTLFSPEGPSITAVQLAVDVVEKGALRVRLPKDAELFGVLVNEESVAVVRDGSAYLFNVSPNTDAERSANVRLVYSAPDAQRHAVELLGPSLDVPLENVTWNMILPPGMRLAGYRGGLRLTGRKATGDFGLNDYAKLSSLTLQSEAKKATALIERANELMKSGDQLQAGEVLSRAANANTGDEALNEDARVQLRTLKTQQAVVGLNTRRQRLYLDNASNSMAIPNEQLEQAASQNAVIQGSTNFDLQQMDQILMGNTADENATLRGIAGRIVEQQLSDEVAPGAIDVTLPASGNVVTFARSIQVDGEAPLTMRLDLADVHGMSTWTVLALLAVMALAGVTVAPRRNEGQGLSR